MNVQDFAIIRTPAKRQSYESQESLGTSTELSCDHRKTRMTSESCRRNTARWPCVYRLHYEIKCIIPSAEDQLLTTFLKDGNLSMATATCIFIREGLLTQKEENHDAIL